MDSNNGGSHQLLATLLPESYTSPNLDSLPNPALETIINRLPLCTVWALWQVNRALRSAIKRCQWQHKVVLYPSAQGNLTADFDGIAATRMFTLGGIAVVKIEPGPIVQGMGAGRSLPANRRTGATVDLSAWATGLSRLDMGALASWNEARAAHPLRAADIQRWVLVPQLTNLASLVCAAAWLSTETLSSLSSLRELAVWGESSGDLLRASASALTKLTSLKVGRARRLNLGTTAEHPAWRCLECLCVGLSDSVTAPWQSFVRLREMEVNVREVELWKLAAAPALEQLTLDVQLIPPPPREQRFVSLRTLTSLEVLGGNPALPLHMLPSLQELCLQISDTDNLSFVGSMSSMPHLTSLCLYNETAGFLLRVPLADFRSLQHLQEVHVPLYLFPRPRDFSGLRFATKVELWHVERAVFGLDLSGLASVHELGLHHTQSLALRSDSVDTLTSLRALTVETRGQDRARHPVRKSTGPTVEEDAWDGGGTGGSGGGGPGGGGGDGSGGDIGSGATESLDADGNTVHELAWVAGAAVLESLSLDATAEPEEGPEDEEAVQEDDGGGYDPDVYTFVSYRAVRWTAGREMSKLTHLHLAGFHSLRLGSSRAPFPFPQLKSLSLRDMEWERMEDVPEGILPELRSLDVAFNYGLRFIGGTWLCLPSLACMVLSWNGELEQLRGVTVERLRALSPRKVVVRGSPKLAANLEPFVAVSDVKFVLQ